MTGEPNMMAGVPLAAPGTLTISVILLTYRRPDELQEALEGLLRQQPLPDEIIVYDDDPDGSGRQAPAVRHPLVRYCCPGVNAGPAGARNRAAAEARGDILFFLDDDCRLESAGMAAVLRALFHEERVGCAACQIRNAFTGQIVPKEFPGYDATRWQEAHRVTYFLAGGFAIRRQAFLDLGGFDALFYHGEEELELSLRLLRAGWDILYTPDILVHHRESPLGRETIRRSYRLIRNRVYLAVKHMPFPYCLSHVVLWSGFALLCALRARALSEFRDGMRSLRADDLLAHARRYRRAHPMPPAALAYLKRHRGRLWY